MGKTLQLLTVLLTNFHCLQARMDNSKSFFFDSFNDDSLLEEISILRRPQKESKNAQEDCDDTLKQVDPPKDDSIELIVLSDDEADDSKSHSSKNDLKPTTSKDSLIVIDSDSNSAQTNDDLRIFDDDRTSDSDDVDLKPQSQPGRDSFKPNTFAQLDDSLSVSIFTTIKDKSTETKPIEEYLAEINNALHSSPNNGDWIEMSDDEDSPIPVLIGRKVTPGKYTRIRSKSKSVIRSLKRTGGGVRCKKSTIDKTVNKNLFVESCDKPIEPKAALKFQKKDSIKHIIVSVNGPVNELAAEEIREHFSEASLRFEVRDDDGNWCVTWKCDSQLESMLRNDRNDHNLIQVGVNGQLDHLLIVISANSLSDYVRNYLQTLSESSTGENESLFDHISKLYKQYSTRTVSLVIFELEKHLRTVRNRANTLFRRRMNELLANEETGTQRRRKQTNDAEEVEITAEQIEMCLLDCKMQFFYQYNQSGARLTILNVESKSELAQTLFRYSRSLSEQIFRFDAIKNSNIDFFSSDKVSAIDPVDSVSYGMLWARQLQQFPSISTAQIKAITTAYQSPLQLTSALMHSSSPVKLLADLEHGGKRVGIELATKISLFLTKNDPDLVLKSR